MKAREVMTANVVSVHPDVPIREVAKLLLEKGISAVPVVDERGSAIGMVSEGDLIGRNETEREARRDWWLALLAEGEELNPEFLASVHGSGRTARDVMSGAVVTVGADTDVSDIARLLAAHRIKRVPVIEDGRIVGIVSRADLLRALAPAPPPRPTASTEGLLAGHEPPRPAAPAPGLLAGVFAGLDEHFRRSRHSEPTAPVAHDREPAAGHLTVGDFQRLVSDFEQKEVQHRDEVRRAAAQEQRRRVAELVDRHISDGGWSSLLHQARAAAEHGEKESMLLRFPSQLCSDGGRAVNAMEPDWPATLRGEAAELYPRWERDLQPHGFHLAARVLEFPSGVPGDIGLFLVWAQ